MMSRSVMHHTSLYLLLTFLTVIDASRILYLPLARLYPSHREFQPVRHIAVEEKLIDNELFPLSAMENMAAEDYETERRELDHLTLTDTDALRSNEVHMGHDQRAAAIQQHSERSKTVETDEQWPTDSAKSHLGHLQFGEAVSDSEQRQQRNDALFLMIVGTCSVFGILGLVAAAIFWYKIQRRAEEALDSEYPSYGVSGPSNSGGKIAPNSAVSDRKLAQSAQMFHYQQQRQQMMAQEKAHLDAKPTHSDDSDDEAPNGGDYTVYECPGLAPTGEMEVRNPLFAEPEPSSSVSHPSTNNHYPQPSSTLPSSSSSTQEKPSS